MSDRGSEPLLAARSASRRSGDGSRARGRRVIALVLILTLLPLHALPRPVEAQGIAGRISRVIPFAGVLVGWNHRNRVYRESERFIRDRNNYYDQLRQTARNQLVKREILGLRPSQTAAYVKMVALLEQQRAAELAVAEARKRQARSEFHSRLEEAAVFALTGSRLAQELIGSMQQGVGSAQQALDRALSTLTSGGTGTLQDLQRIRHTAGLLSAVAGAIGGRAGHDLQDATDRIIQVIDRPQREIRNAIESVQADLAGISQMLDALSRVGRIPTAGELRDEMTTRFLPGGGESTNISLEAIASVLSQLEVGDGSLRDEARSAIRSGFVARCTALSEAYHAHIDALDKSGQTPPDPADLPPDCQPIKRGDLIARAGGPAPTAAALPTEPEPTEQILPRVTASGQFSETVAGATNTSRPMGTTFRLVADLAAGTISGSLTGGRTTSGNPITCVSAEDPSVILDTAVVDYTDAYKADFSGSIDPESGDFSVAITPKGSTSDRKTTPFSAEGCQHLNGQPAPGSVGWTGQGTISGFVTQDGYVEFSTRWTSYGGNILVTGNWSGPGEVTTP